MKETFIYISKLFTDFISYLQSFFSGDSAAIASSGAHAMNDQFLQSICIYFTSTPGIIVQVMFILIVGCKNWRSFSKKISNIHKQLNAQIALLESVKNKAEFIKKFNEIDLAFSKSSILTNAWREFKNVLLMSGSHPMDDDCIVNTQYPYYFFSETTVIRPFINLSYFNAIPNKLTGLGIMGTFLGLVAGIYLAAAGISSNNMEEAKLALSHLLDGASLGFLTSVAGLGCSLIFSWREKNTSFKSSQLINKINELLEINTQYINSEYLNCLLLLESKKQLQSFEGFSSQVSEHLGKVLHEKMATPLITHLDKIQNTLEILSDNQVKAADETIKQLIEEFSQKISGAAGREMRAFASVLQRTTTELNTQITTISSSQENLQRNVKETVSGLLETFSDGSNKMKEEMNNSISKIVYGVSNATKEMSEMLKDTTGNSIANMSKAIQEFESVILKLKSSSSDIVSITQNNSTLAEEIRVMLDSIESVYTKISNVVSPISNISNNLSTTSESLVKGMIEFEAISKNNTDSLKLLQQVQTELKSNWNGYLSRFESVDETLGNAVEGLNNGYAGFVKSTNSYLIGLDKNTAQVVDKLAVAVRELSTVVDDWQVGA